MSAASDFRDRCRRIGWAAGLPGLALLLGLSALWVTPAVEADLARQGDAIARSMAEPGAEPWLRVAAEGRDLVITGEAPDARTRDKAHERLARIEGMRRLVGPVGLVEPVSPFTWVATRTRDGVDLTGYRPAEIGAGALAERLGPALEPGTALHDRTRAALGAPPDFPAVAAYGLARLRALIPESRVMLEDMRISVIGEAASVPDDEALRAALVDLPAGYSLGRVEIVPAKVPDFRFVVTRLPGGIDLSGHVVSEAARAAIREEATRASETGRIKDRMRTARGLSRAVDAGAMARFALGLLNLMQEGSITVADEAVSVSGVALDAQAIPEIEAQMRASMPAGLGRGSVTLTTQPLTPYRIGIRRDPDSVTVTGHLPDLAARDALLASLRPRLYRERLVDRTRFAEGAPPGLARALQASAGSLALLARGEVRIADRAVTLSGESLYPQSARRIRDDLPAAMPEGWSVEVAVTTPGESPVLTPEACAAAIEAGPKEPAPTFSPGSITLKPAFYPRLDAIAALARKCPALRLVVTGHSDPIDGTPAPKPAVDAAVESTASLKPGREAGSDAAALLAAKALDVRTPGDKAAKSDLSSRSPPAKSQPAKSQPATPDPKATPKADAKAVPAAKVDRAAKADPVAKTASAAKAVSSAKSETKPPEPDPELAQMRALAIIEYLLQAGLRPEQVSAASPGTDRPAAQGVGFAARS